MHYHANDPAHPGGYCHNNSHYQRDPCNSDLRLFWTQHSGSDAHRDATTLACPPSEQIIVRLTGPAGLRLELQIKVDAAAVNAHAEPQREFRVYTTNGGCSPAAADCAVPGTHYDAVLKDGDGNDVTTLTFDFYGPQTVYLHTLIDLDHGTQDRLLTITVQDTHVLRGHIYASEQVIFEPPMRGTN